MRAVGYNFAQENAEKGLALRSSLLGWDDPVALSSLHHLTWVQSHQGRYEAAEKLSRRALEGREKVLGAEHPNTLTSVSMLAQVLQAQGKYAAAAST
jgi:hypothetical protein